MTAGGHRTMRIIPDYFREMAERTLQLVPAGGQTRGATYLVSVAQRYFELAEEAEKHYVPFEPARLYAPSLYAACRLGGKHRAD